MKKELSDKLEMLIIETLNIRKKLKYKLFDKEELYPGQSEVLKIISENQGITGKEIARINNTKPSSVTEMLKRLELNGYITKQVDYEDRRNTKVYLTSKGKTICNKCIELKNIFKEKIFVSISEQEQIDLINTINKMADNMNNMLNEL